MERIGVPALVVAEVAAVLGLHRLGHLPWLAIQWGDLPLWLATVRPEDAVAATARVVALACAYWLLATTLAYVATRRSRSTAARLTRRLTPAAVRRLADRAVVFGLAGALSGLPAAAGAADGPPPVVVLDDGRLVVAPPGPPPRPATDADAARTDETWPPPRPATDADAPRTDETWPPPRPATDADAPRADETWPPPPSVMPPDRPDRAPRPQPPPAGTDDEAAADHDPVLHARPGGTSEVRVPSTTADTTVYTVRSEDNLWSISARTLAAARGRPVRQLSDGEVARYWVRVIDANRATLRSGDPDLIHPGEQVVLPSPGEDPR
ncbi:MAG: hypothetical protein KY462_04005 [Actinobacteria bacterium]|nr:hypothetical protein [Actinomycetota bacterium]